MKKLNGVSVQADGTKLYTYRITDMKVIKDIMDTLTRDSNYGIFMVGGMHERVERFQDAVCSITPQSLDEAFMLTQAIARYDTTSIYIQTIKPHYNSKIKSSVAVDYVDIEFTYTGKETLLDFDLIPRYVGIQDIGPTKPYSLDVSVLVGFDLDVIESEYENNEEVKEDADCE